MGPHGLLIGATGSGKSELLRTLVLALAVTHSPGTLNFALIDFKGGATFARMDALPHTSAVITNLQNALSLVDRMTDALNGELIRRQELLRAAGNFSSFHDYERARAAGAPLPEVPTLLVVVRRVQRAAVAEAGLHRHVRHDRPGRPVAGRAPAAGVATARGGAAARAGRAPVVPDRAADLLGRGEPHGHRGDRRVRAAARAGTRLPPVRHRAAGAFPVGVRVRRAPAPGRPPRRDRAGRAGRDAGLDRRRTCAAAGDRGAETPRSRTTSATACSTSWSGGWRARARRRIRCGCRRWTTRRPWTRCWPAAERGTSTGRALRRWPASWTGRSTSAATRSSSTCPRAPGTWW